MPSLSTRASFPSRSQTLPRRARLGFGRAWVLHRKLMLRGIAAGVVAASACVGAYEARDDIAARRGRRLRAGAGQFAQRRLRHLRDQHHRPDADQRGRRSSRRWRSRPTTSTLNFDADAALARIEAIPSVKSGDDPQGLSGRAHGHGHREGADGALAHRRHDLPRRRGRQPDRRRRRQLPRAAAGGRARAPPTTPW